MKLAEALMERKDLVKQVNKTKEEIESNLVTKEGFELPLDMKELFNKFEQLQIRIRELNFRIDKTNAVVLLENLSELRMLDSMIAFYRTCRKSLLDDSSSHYYNESVKMKRNYDINDINDELEKLESERRALDKDIQKINWATELIKLS